MAKEVAPPTYEPRMPRWAAKAITSLTGLGAGHFGGQIAVNAQFLEMTPNIATSTDKQFLDHVHQALLATAEFNDAVDPVSIMVVGVNMAGAALKLESTTTKETNNLNLPEKVIRFFDEKAKSRPQAILQDIWNTTRFAFPYLMTKLYPLIPMAIRDILTPDSISFGSVAILAPCIIGGLQTIHSLAKISVKAMEIKERYGQHQIKTDDTQASTIEKTHTHLRGKGVPKIRKQLINSFREAQVQVDKDVIGYLIQIALKDLSFYYEFKQYVLDLTSKNNGLVLGLPEIKKLHKGFLEENE